MEIEIKLDFNYGYPWYKYRGNYAKGYVIENEKTYNEKYLPIFLDKIQEFDELKEILKKLHGIFAAILERDNFLYLITDITRTFPLFYTINDNKIIISDNTFYIKNRLKPKLNPFSCAEFLKCGYTSGSETILQGVYQVQAGEILTIDKEKGEIKKEFYYDYTVTKKEIYSKNYNKLKDDLLKIFDHIIDRVLYFAKENTIVIPLSGGYDSRLIAALLKKNGYENVICYTYGLPNSSEAIVARKVAKRLGYDWYFIEQTDALVDPFYPDSDWFFEFYKYAFNHVSATHLQDFFVFKYLHENKLLPKNSIIAPGHSGDFLAGSHLRKLPLPKRKENVVSRILAKHYILNDSIKLNKKIIQKLREYIENYPNETFPYSIDDNWNMKERQAKYIVNSNRTYEFFGYRHIIPLWDIEIVEFFRKLPIKYKYNQILYNDVIRNNIFNKFNISLSHKEWVRGFGTKFYYNVFHSWRSFKYLRYFAETYFPSFLKRPLKNIVRKEEVNMRAVAGPIASSLKTRYRPSEFNKIIGYWCLKMAGFEIAKPYGGEYINENLGAC